MKKLEFRLKYIEYITSWECAAPRRAAPHRTRGCISNKVYQTENETLDLQPGEAIIVGIQVSCSAAYSSAVWEMGRFPRLFNIAKGVFFVSYS